MKIKISLAIFFLMLAGATFSEGDALPFIHDDYTKALTEARQRNLPIFVECWAPW